MSMKLKYAGMILVASGGVSLILGFIGSGFDISNFWHRFAIVSIVVGVILIKKG